jgi:hypothetical protein
MGALDQGKKESLLNSGQRIVSGTLEQLARIDFGAPLHSLVIVGSGVHDLEKDMLAFFKAKDDEPLYVEPEETDKNDGNSSEEES